MRQLFNQIATVFFILLFFAGCESRKEGAKMLYTVVRTDFSDAVQIEGTVRSVHSTQILCPEDIRWRNCTILYMAEDGQLVRKGDTVCVLESLSLLELEETVKEVIDTKKAAYDVGLASLASEYARLEAQARNNELEASLSNLDSLQMLYYSPSQRRIAELNLQKSRITQQKIDRNLATTKFINEKQVKLLELELQQSFELQDWYASMLDQMVILSPGDGMFLRSENPDTREKYLEGDEVASDELATLPDPSVMEVYMRAPESVYKRLAYGQKVTFSFDALPGKLAWGHIKFKASVGRAYSWQSSVTVYDVVAAVDSATVMPTAGFSANSLISLTSLPDTLVVPQVAVFDKDSIRVVYIKQGMSYIEQQVNTVAFSSKEMVVSDGLKGGEVLSLIQPKPSAIGETRLLSADTSSVSKQL